PRRQELQGGHQHHGHPRGRLRPRRGGTPGRPARPTEQAGASRDAGYARHEMIWRWYEERRLRMLASKVHGKVLDIGFAEWPNRQCRLAAVVTVVDMVDAPLTHGYARQVVCNFHA